MCLAVDAHVGNLVEPDLRCRVHGREVRERQTVEEVFLDVVNTLLDPALLPAGADVALTALIALLPRRGVRPSPPIAGAAQAYGD